VKNEGTAKVEVDYVGPARMDGRDEKMLLASYEGPSNNPIGTMFAWVKPQPRPKADNPPVVYAAAAMPLPRARPADLEAYPPAPTSQNPLILAPAFAPSDDDPLAPLIMRSSFVTSYADNAGRTAAQNAADDLVNGRFKTTGLEAALANAASKYRQEHTSAPGAAIVQLGSFGDPVNAKRAADRFGRYGTVSTTSQDTLTTVRVSVDATAAASVVDAAKAAGLQGAFILAE
jgi:rare lipoprotein A